MNPGASRTRLFLSDGDPASKQAILQAALALFVQHGLAATSIRMIGAAAGYTNPAMFKFFESKDALALYLFERCYARLFVAVDAAVSTAAFDDALAGVVRAFLEAMDNDLEATLFVQDSLRELWPRLPAAARKQSILGALARLFRRGIREGRVRGYRSADIPVAAVVGLVAQLGRMLYFREVPGPASRHGPEIELAVGRMLGG
jgi:TetR/AcrR family transcriptional regulator, repressor of fatR-cypB operon